MTIHTPELRDIADALWSLASQHPTADAYWIATPDGELPSGNGNDWCRKCGMFKLNHLRRHDRKRRDEYILDGGWISEHDGPIYCAHCGVRLRSSMLSTGAGWEIEHYSQVALEASPGDAYDVHEVLVCLEYAREESAILVAEALDLGRRLLAILKQTEDAAASTL